MALTDWRQLHHDRFDGVRALITGGAGFIGSHLAEALLDLGATVIVFDDFSGGSMDNLEPLRQKHGKRLEILKASLLQRELLDLAASDCRFVFHQAAWGSVPRSVEMPVHYHEVNATGTVNLLEAAKKAGVRRVVFAASSSAYGDTETLPKVETMPARPLSPYAASKVACEALLRAHAHCYDIDAASLRYFNIFGPRQNANSAYAAVIAAFAKALFHGENPVIFGDGEQSRDFTFVDNAVHANLLAAGCETPLRGEVMNIACGQRVTVNQLCQRMIDMWKRKGARIAYQPERAGDVKHSLADLTLAGKLIGYKPIVNFDAGLDATVQWYRETMS